MNDFKKVIIDGNEVIERPLNTDELQQLEKDRAEAEAAYAEIAPALEAAKAKRQLALDKLAALGLEEDDLKALGL
jgi:hypothetical protein